MHFLHLNMETDLHECVPFYASILDLEWEQLYKGMYKSSLQMQSKIGLIKIHQRRIVFLNIFT